MMPETPETNGEEGPTANDIYKFALERAQAGQKSVTSPSDPIYQRVLCGMLSSEVNDFRCGMDVSMMLDADFESAAAGLVRDAEELALYYPQDLVLGPKGKPTALHPVSFLGLIALPTAVAKQIFKGGACDIDASALQISLNKWAAHRKAAVWMDPHLYDPNQTHLLPPSEWRTYLQRIGCRLGSGGAGKIVFYEQGYGCDNPFYSSVLRTFEKQRYSVVCWSLIATFAIPAARSACLDGELYDDDAIAPIGEWYALAAQAVQKSLPLSMYEPLEFLADHLIQPVESGGGMAELFEAKMPERRSSRCSA